MSVILTEKAAAEVRRRLDDQKADETTMLRVQITAGGCSGFNYGLAFASDFSEADDTKFDCHGVPVVVDKKSALFLEGTTIDFQDDLQGYGFRFDNPNAVKTCGCGSSFQA
ncbi:iron-sulfur cluster assembly accessory protein [Aeoliella sp. ICT_H6.2]|uniref:Iron-sulfur cluster assembly accessory protein n=1 Tax=Aeoliella straminimaris TaxID=2954799 RepID=A0A9X2FDQ7_9BACT|nr:iron-sulfur cluster assembly accessory protein [Aeoliella straminimaris]MCO6044449.1 iron-sulfur cluster assembly accessory protein [Aeoliella straminimaris]